MQLHIHALIYDKHIEKKISGLVTRWLGNETFEMAGLQL